MASLLEEFAYGNVSPELETFDKNSKYGKVLDLIVRIEQKLLNNFGPEDKDLFTKYIDAQAEASQHTAVENLTHGYKMGLVMAAEAFTGMNNLYIGGQEL